jgi:hypothetical protein
MIRAVSPMTTHGATLGSYRIDRQFGGGMGTVFLADDSTLRRPVTRKVMSEGMR